MMVEQNSTHFYCYTNTSALVARPSTQTCRNRFALALVKRAHKSPKLRTGIRFVAKMMLKQLFFDSSSTPRRGVSLFSSAIECAMQQHPRKSRRWPSPDFPHSWLHFVECHLGTPFLPKRGENFTRDQPLHQRRYQRTVIACKQ